MINAIAYLVIILLFFVGLVLVFIAGEVLRALNIALWLWWEYGRRNFPRRVFKKEVMIPPGVWVGGRPLGVVALLIATAGAVVILVVAPGLSDIAGFVMMAGLLVAAMPLGSILSGYKLFGERLEEVLSQVHKITQDPDGGETAIKTITARLKDENETDTLLNLYRRYWRAEFLFQSLIRKSNKKRLQRLLKDLHLIESNDESDRSLLRKCKKMRAKLQNLDSLRANALAVYPKA